MIGLGWGGAFLTRWNVIGAVGFCSEGARSGASSRALRFGSNSRF